MPPSKFILRLVRMQSEFIIAYGDSVRRELVSIKDHQIYRNCKEAWLGSFEAYKEFRRLGSEISTDDVKGKKSITYTDDGKFVEEDIDENIIRSYKKEGVFFQSCLLGM